VSNLDHIRSYYRALNTGDVDLVASHFTDDAVHYYTRRDPHRGARAIAENAALAVRHLDARWTLENAVGDGEQVAIEWSMLFNHPRTGARMLDRGAEFFLFRDGLIREVRAYYNERGGDLRGFDHAARGHTVL
jgi:ketosteroid isomerase-like protein